MGNAGRGESDRDPRTYAIIGAAMEVHRELGPGFLERVYQDALEIEFGLRNIPHVREFDLRVHYKEFILRSRYDADFMCYEQVVVETKAQSALTGADEAQLINYLKGTRVHVGLLVNFGTPSLEYRRMVF